MIVDAHCHYGTGDRLSAPATTRASLGRYLRRADAAGIARTIVFPTFTSDYRPANRAVARLAASRPDRFLAFACVDADRDTGRVGELVEEAVRAGAVGLKVHRHDAPLSREVCDGARRHRLPILYDPMGDIPPVGLVAAEFPDVPLIVPHLGSFADDWRAHVAVIDLLLRFPNVYTDTSGIKRFDYLVEAVRRAGPGKVIFGSDGPWLHPGLELAKVRALGLAPADEAAILGGTILRLIRRPERSTRTDDLSGPLIAARRWRPGSGRPGRRVAPPGAVARRAR